MNLVHVLFDKIIKSKITILAILILAFIVRLYKFDNPIADWHSWRQADTSSVSREFVKNGTDFLHPKYHDLSKIPSGKDNLEGYRFVEFPIYNFLQAQSFLLFGYFTLEEWGRIVTIFASVLSTYLIYVICRRYLGITSALFAAISYAFLPFSIYYGRTILPDQMVNVSVLISIFFFILWRETSFKLSGKGIIYYILSLLFAALSLLFKPFAAFFLLPIAAVAFESEKLKALKRWSFWIFLIFSVVPLVLWRIWIMQFPEGIPDSSWLFNAENIRFKGAYFYWIFGERLSKLILGYFALPLFLLGIFKQKKEEHFLFFSTFLLSTFLYLSVVARGNVQHDYYQILIIPTIAIFVGRGVSVFSEVKGINKVIFKAMVIVTLLLSISLSWFYVRDYFNINNPNIVTAGNTADKILPKDDLVIAPYNGDTSFLYQTNRRGWPVWQEDLEGMIQKGADDLILVSPTDEDINGLGKKYKVLASSSAYLILKLHK